jgi:hypothetical protein
VCTPPPSSGGPPAAAVRVSSQPVVMSIPDTHIILTYYNILYSLTKYLLYRVPHSNLMSRRLQSTAAVVQAGAIGLAEAACTRFGAATMTHKKASNLLKLLK